ncbi:MAG: hypothetical protein EPO67_00450 [Reyranella sp.]|nr:MAG: hypothetical protein EPO67_00450 [Reyranella sp.]
MFLRVFSGLPVALIVAAAASPAVADDRSQKYRSNGCEVERKADGFKYESKVECKGGGPARFREAKEEFRQGPCLVKREWKKDGEYKEEVKCD